MGTRTVAVAGISLAIVMLSMTALATNAPIYLAMAGLVGAAAAAAMLYAGRSAREPSRDSSRLQP
jgi:hypothetical protein